MTSHQSSPPPPAVPPRSGAARWVRVLVGVGLMAALLYYANPAEVVAVLARASPGWLLAAGAIVLVDRVANAYRWLTLLRAIEPARHIAATAAIRVFFVSGFFGSFLPGSVGGDAVRTLALSRLDVPPADAFASVMVDRLLGVVSVLLMAAVSLVITGGRLSPETATTLWLTAGGLLAACLVLLLRPRALTIATTWLIGAWLPRLSRLLTRALGAIEQYSHRGATLGGVLILSIGVQVLRTLQAWTLGQALGIQAGLIWYFAFVPIVVLVMLLPTSVAGLGTGALAFQLLFGTVGVSSAETFALATLFSVTSLVGTLPGAFMRFPSRT